MATKYPDTDDVPAVDNDAEDHQTLSENNTVNADSIHVSQRQLSDSRIPTQCFIFFENSSGNQVRFIEYFGTHARKHQSSRLFVPQAFRHRDAESPDETYEQFANAIRQVLSQIPANDLASYIVSVRTGVQYFFSKRFLFKNIYTMEEIYDVLRKQIPVTDDRYYFQRESNSRYQSDESLRSTFANVKPINHHQNFVDELQQHEFYVERQKHVFRIYLQSDDKQTHVCVVDPAANYSITEFSKDFQRTSNIDVIRDRHSSKFRYSKTYDDIFDFRTQFQYNPCTRSDQMDTIEYELRQQFPSLDQDFKNEFLLEPMESDEKLFYISPQLCPYVRFIRRDFGAVYQYTGDDQLFENFTIYLESCVEFNIDKNQSICKPALDTHGLVYARLDLSSIISSNHIDETLLIDKLWDMGIGLTTIAGKCTTSETQQSTNYYSSNGNIHTAEHHVIIQRILKQTTLLGMLGLPRYAKKQQIIDRYNSIDEQLRDKWHCVPKGIAAQNKLNDYYEQYLNQNN